MRHYCAAFRILALYKLVFIIIIIIIAIGNVWRTVRRIYMLILRLNGSKLRKSAKKQVELETESHYRVQCEYFLNRSNTALLIVTQTTFIWVTWKELRGREDYRKHYSVAFSFYCLNQKSALKAYGWLHDSSHDF